MAQPTENLGLPIFDFLTEGSTYFEDWVDSLTSNKVTSAMVKLDDAIALIQKEGSSFAGEIIGDNVKTSFSIKHNRNTLSPVVSVFDNETKEKLSPGIKVINANELVMSFIYPLTVGQKLTFSII